MRATSPAPDGPARGESGFTLIELLVAMLVLFVVMVGTLTTLDGSNRLAVRDAERSHAVREAQVGLDRMVRELRHARAVVGTPTATSITVVTKDRRTTADVTRTIAFACGPYPTPTSTPRCTRTEGTATEVLVDRVDPPAGGVFSYTPATGTPRYVTVELPVKIHGGRSDGYTRNSVFSDGTRLRNVP